MADDKGSNDNGPAESGGEHSYTDTIETGYIDGLTFRSKPVQYVVVDEMAVVEGDILLGPVDRVREQTAMRRAEIAGEAVAAGVAVSGSQFRWPDCRIPYQIAEDLPNQNRVTDAIEHWEANTNFRFVLRTPANAAQFGDFVEFVPGSGCRSFVGRQGGRQTVVLGDGCTTGNCIHEIGHVVGLWHEQSREDRDAFVTIQFANIIPAAVSNFNQHITDGDDIGAYDYGSIMHYPRNAFSANGQDTIVPVDPNAQIGQRNGLSAGDIAAAGVLCVKNLPKDPPKEIPKDIIKEFPKDPPKDFPKDLPKDPPKDRPKDIIKEFPKERPKDPPKDFPKDLPKDPPKDRPKDIIKEFPKDGPLEPPKGFLEPPKGVLEPPKGLLEPPKQFDPGPGPFPGGGGVPFVLGTGMDVGGAAAQAQADARQQTLQQYRQVLDRYARLHASGLLGPDDLATWQQYATAAQELAEALGMV